MPKKVGFFARAIVLSLILLVLLLPGWIVETKPVCGCGPIDLGVSISLYRLDHLVQEYAAAHNGLYPTYAELAAIAGQRDRQRVVTSIRLQMLSYYEEERGETILTATEREKVESYKKGDLSIDQLGITLDREEIGRLVSRYRIEHPGSRTYDHYLNEAEEEYNDFSSLTPEVDFNRRNFRVRQTTMGPIGYAVAPDRRSYLLIGVGWGERSVSLYHVKILPLGPGPRILNPQTDGK